MSVFIFNTDGDVDILPHSLTSFDRSRYRQPALGRCHLDSIRAFLGRMSRRDSHVLWRFGKRCVEPRFFLSIPEGAFLAVDTASRLVSIYDRRSGGWVILSTKSGRRACLYLPWKSVE